MLVAFAPLIAFAVSGADPHDRREAAAEVAEAIADADQIVRVHEAPGVIVFDLDRAGELFQLTVGLDDDGRVTASAIDWTGPTGRVEGVAPVSLDRIERIELDGGRRVILHGDGTAVTLHATVAR